MTKHFFDEQRDQSIVKARIIQKYFGAWANIILPWAEKDNLNMAYIDLYAGPGRYKDGAASTPLFVLQTAISNPRLAKRFIGYFNDADKNNMASLSSEISKLDGIEKLAHRPVISNGEVGQDAANFYAATRLVPSFTFLDPWGYKGLSLKIVNGVIKDWGCDCVFFFNYSRINSGIPNDAVEEHMMALFGDDRTKRLREKVTGLTSTQRETVILEELSNALKGMGGRFVLPFRFKTEGGRPTHHLIFVSKNFRGYDVMKQIMARESSTEDQNVPSFTYCQADARTPLLFSLAQPLANLKAKLLIDFAGKQLSVKDIYESHSVDKPYILSNYKQILLELEREQMVTVTSLKTKRPPGTMAEHLMITFPPRQS